MRKLRNKPEQKQTLLTSVCGVGERLTQNPKTHKTLKSGICTPFPNTTEVTCHATCDSFLDHGYFLAASQKVSKHMLEIAKAISTSKKHLVAKNATFSKRILQSVVEIQRFSQKARNDQKSVHP